MIRQVFGGTDIGQIRTSNQDRFSAEVVNENMGYGIVCDGMGGENGGSVASEIAIEFARKLLSRDLSGEMTELSIRAVFSSIFSATNALIFEAASKNEELKGMGTTMVMAVIKNRELFIGTVGDSRVYIAGPEETRQVTKDHTVVQLMVDIGELTAEEAASHPKRHFITRAVGVSDTVEMDFIVEKLGEKDIVLLCSDGLYNYLDPEELYETLRETADVGSVQNLIDVANEGGGADNITAVVML